MKKLVAGFFAGVMILGIAFLGDAVSSSSPFSAQAQTVTVKRRSVNAGRRVYRGGRWVVTRSWRGGKWVARKTWQGGRWVTVKTVKGTRYAAHKTKRGAKRTFHKVKRAIY